ncbi:putative minor capsid protein [Eel River basin pequenovirus]|uniref:putative minor capsid protein n=1 Tax=Eel River basin pequenovirus TaxID=1609634 RepID=UPI0005B23985|nr:putative minor capsid protein [Eel River basin pequenovirus]AJK28215.1 putative minor capsid protein [Eel River basin pequenovirus]
MIYEVAKSAMSVIANQANVGHLSNCGLSQEDFKKVTGSAPWAATDRNHVMRAFTSLLYGTLDAIGLPRFTLPAEYIAAGIVMFVHPTNAIPACRFFERNPSADDLGRGVDEVDHVTAKQLMGLVVQLYADNAKTSAVALFEKNTKLKIAQATEVEEEETIGRHNAPVKK